MSTAAQASTGRKLGASFRTTVLVQVMGTITGIVLARSLGVDDRGELAAAILWPLVFGAIGTLGLEESATYHVARDPGSVGRVIGSGLALAGCQALVFAALCAAVIPLVLGRHEEMTVYSALIYVLYIPLNAVGVLLRGVLNGLHRYRAFNVVRLVIGVLTILAMVILLATGRMSVRAMVIGYLIAWASTALIAAALVARARPPRPRADRRTLRSMFGFGIRSHASTASSHVNQRLDVLLISVFLSSRQLGLYVVAISFTSWGGIVGPSVAAVALPTIARLEPGPARTLLARRLLSLTLLISAIAVIPAVLLAPQIIELLFGASFLGATDPMRVLLVAGVAFSMSRAMESVLRAVGRPLDAGIAEIIAVGATVAGLAVLLPAFGILGAGIASLIAYSVSCAWMARRASRALEVSALELLLPDRDAIWWVVARGRELARQRRRAKA